VPAYPSRRCPLGTSDARPSQLPDRGIATFVAAAAAVETCGTDPTKTISADGVETIRVKVPVTHPA
jgi:hypothetical protein